MSAFVDTWAWLALIDKRDDNHVVAQVASEELIEQKTLLVTTNFVLAEATTLIRYKVHHPAAVDFRRMIRQMTSNEVLQVVRITAAHEEAAGEIFDRYREMDLSFTDCTSFVVLRELGLFEVFTGDHHFRAMGFVLIP